MKAVFMGPHKLGLAQGATYEVMGEIGKWVLLEDEDGNVVAVPPQFLWKARVAE